MQPYKTRTNRLPGSDFREVHGKAFVVYRKIKQKSKRRPYVRSKYFKNDKVFLEFFWRHLFDKKNWQDRTRRLKYFPAAIELVRHTTLLPRSKENPNKSSEILHRFAGLTCDNYLFYVQIKEDKRTSNKYLFSVFPAG